MTAVTRPRPASTRCCSPLPRRLPAATPTAVPSRTAPTLTNVPSIDAGGWQGGWALMAAVDVLIVSLGSTAGLRAADAALARALRRARGRGRGAPPQRPRGARPLAPTHPGPA